MDASIEGVPTETKGGGGDGEEVIKNGSRRCRISSEEEAEVVVLGERWKLSVGRR
jgi:hypothetical protein